MKIPNKQELKPIVLNHLSDIGLKDLLYQYKKRMERHNLF